MVDSTLRSLRILYVANKRLPDNDYRMRYREWSRMAQLTYGLPQIPPSLQPHEFVRLGFGESLKFKDVWNFINLIRHLRRCHGEYDLVHFFSTKLQLLGPLCAWMAGMPCMTTITGFGRTFSHHEVRYRLLRLPYMLLVMQSLLLSRKAFFQNRGDMKWLARQLPCFRGKLHWIGSGVEAEVVMTKDFQKKPLMVLMVARLMEEKGVPLFLDAARRLQGPGFRFVLVGPPSAGQHALHRRTVLSHEEGIVDYRGELTQDELNPLYRESHVFVFPSQYGEGMPRVMLEAGYGLMCPVATDIAAHRDLIAPGRGCYLASTRDAESLVDHLVRLDADRFELEQQARAYQQHVVTRYAMSAYSQRMDKCLQGMFS